jgi:phosphonate transport system ATP-binding protein
MQLTYMPRIIRPMSQPSHPSEAAPLLTLRDACVTYPGGVTGLARTSLQFVPGEFSVLLGPSGAGKSTLLRSLNGLVPLSSGSLSTARLGMLQSAAAWREHRRDTGMVFQQHQLIGRLSVLRNVLTGRLAFVSTLRSLWPASAADRRIALEALERVGLLETALRRTDQLSGGQQQRVGIARALAQQPRLLLADEPVASLDPATASKVLELLHGICRETGIAAIVSLHQVDLARRFADRIVGVARGSVVFDGPAERLDDATLNIVYGDGQPPVRLHPTASHGAVPALAHASIS